MSLLSRTAVACAGVLLFLLLGTDPRDLPSVVLVAPFILFFVLLLVGAFFMMRSWGLDRAKALRFGSFIAAVPVLLLVLQSLGQLTFRDMLVIFIFFGVAYFYASRMSVRSA